MYDFAFLTLHSSIITISISISFESRGASPSISANFSTIGFVDLAIVAQSACTTFSFADLQTRKKARSGLVGALRRHSACRLAVAHGSPRASFTAPQVEHRCEYFKSNPLSLISTIFFHSLDILLFQDSVRLDSFEKVEQFRFSFLG